MMNSDDMMMSKDMMMPDKMSSEMSNENSAQILMDAVIIENSEKIEEIEEGTPDYMPEPDYEPEPEESSDMEESTIENEMMKIKENLTNLIAKNWQKTGTDENSKKGPSMKHLDISDYAPYEGDLLSKCDPDEELCVKCSKEGLKFSIKNAKNR